MRKENKVEYLKDRSAELFAPVTIVEPGEPIVLGIDLFHLVLCVLAVLAVLYVLLARFPSLIS
jgi:hypothetical protein